MAKPEKVKNVFVNKRNNFAIVKWDKVKKDINNNDIVPTGYKVYKAEKTNLLDLAVIDTITTTDSDGDIDTIYLDMNAYLDDKLYFYKITALLNTEESELSEEAVDFHFLDLKDTKGEPKIDQYGRFDISKYDLSKFS